jgi:hypothetical protein
MAWKAPKVVDMCATRKYAALRELRRQSPVSNGGAFLLGLLLAIKSRGGRAWREHSVVLRA